MSRWARLICVLLLTFPTGCASLGPVRFRAPEEPSPQSSLSSDRETSAPGLQEAQLDVPPAVTQSGHDAETRNRIELELRDATPAEREQWLAVLEHADAAQVTRILQARRQQMTEAQERLARAVSQTEVVPASHSAESTPDAATKPDAATAPDDGLPVITPSGRTAAENSQQTANAPAQSGSPSWQKRILALAEAPFGMPHIPGMPGRAPGGTAEPEETPAPAADSSPTTPPVSNELRIAPGSAVWEDEMHKLISLLEAETIGLADNSRSQAERDDLRKQVALRMLCLISDDPQRAQQPIPGISTAEQEFWSELFMGLGEYLDVNQVADPSARATQTIAQLKAATYHLQQSARLQLRNVTFCENINQFGSYEPFEENLFPPGSSVQVYAEIRNFESQPTIDGFYRTSIKSTIEIQRSGTDPQLIDRNVFKPTEDLCRTLRTDYFHSYRVDLPAHLTPGPHLLKLTITDEISGKTATETLSFVVK